MNSQDLILTMMRAQGKTDALSLRSRSAGMDGTAIIAEEEKIPAFNPEKDYSSWPPFDAPSALGACAYQEPGESKALCCTFRNKRALRQGRVLHRP